jgi:Putative restriction endonuclease
MPAAVHKCKAPAKTHARSLVLRVRAALDLTEDQFFELCQINHGLWIERTAEGEGSILPRCPDFVLELRAPILRLRDLQTKLREYIANGARLGWLLDPKRRQVYVMRRCSASTTLKAYRATRSCPASAWTSAGCGLVCRDRAQPKASCSLASGQPAPGLRRRRPRAGMQPTPTEPSSG